MSRNALVLEKMQSQAPACANRQLIRRTGEYTGLACRFCRSRCVIAAVAADKSARIGSACRGIAADIAATHQSVVIVRVDDLARVQTVPSAKSCSPSGIPNVWIWPAAEESGVDFYRSQAEEPVDADWLAALRREFDSVVLECSTQRPQIAALADTAVLVVEAGKTAREKVKSTQRTLERSGVKLQGCVLMLGEK